MHATAFDLVLGPKPKTDRVTTEVLVLGAECDGFVSQDEVRATARAYRTSAEMFAAMGHNMMVEPAWRAVADRIIEWLGSRGL